MFIFIDAFFIGTASRLQALIGLAAASWVAHFGILPLSHTWLAFLKYTFTPYILTLMAIGELVNDKLPKTPSRLIPPQFITRILTSTLCDLAIALSGNGMIVGSGNHRSCSRNIRRSQSNEPFGNGLWTRFANYSARRCGGSSHCGVCSLSVGVVSHALLVR